MNQQIKKWTLRIIVTGIFILGLLMTIVLNPVLTYANKYTHKDFTIYYSANLDPLFVSNLDQATELLKKSELNNKKFKIDICLSDGSQYPEIIKAIRGQAFALGFYNKVVLQGTMNCKYNYVELNGYKWNLSQLLAHEMIHCLQYNTLGFWNSKPIAKVDNWKWEGYAEYISRQDTNLLERLYKMDKFQKEDNNTWEITLDDSTITSREYYHYWNLVQYCLEIKKMSYTKLLTDTTSEDIIKQEMMNWYTDKKANVQQQLPK